MEENKNIWNKKMDELTVKDVIIVNVALPVFVIGGIAGAGAVVGGLNAAKDKFQQFRTTRKSNLKVVDPK